MACVGIAMAAAIVAAGVYARTKYLDRHRFDRDLSKRITAYDFYERDEIRIYDRRLRKYVTTGLEWVADAPARDTLTVFARDGRRGYLNVRDGRIVIEAQYDRAWVFSEGLGAVVKDGKIGFVDAQGRTVLPFAYDYAVREGVRVDYLFRDGCCPMTDAQGACGLIDRTGRWVVEPQYDCIETASESGCRIVTRDGKYGLLGPDRSLVYLPVYDCIEFAADGEGILLTRDGIRWKSDFEGKVVRSLVYDNSYWIYIPDDGEQERFSGFMKFVIGDKEGVFRRDDGRVIIPARYACVNMLSEHLFEAQSYDEGDWVLFDTEGNPVQR